jgi:hypothetical protein
MSWIDHDDLIGVIHRCLFDERLAGAVNAVAPRPARNAEFARTLGRVLRRPVHLALPSPVVRAAFGELGLELLLSGAQVHPTALLRAGFPFRHGELERSLRSQLGRFADDPSAPQVRFER